MATVAPAAPDRPAVLGVLWDDLPRLRSRAVSILHDGPVSAARLAEELFGLTRAPAGLAARLVRDLLADDRRFAFRRGAWRLRPEKGAGDARLDELDFVIVDVEATGGSPARGDRITEVAAIRVSGGRIVESLESLINPGRPIPRAVTALTNITDEMVAGAPTFSELAEDLRRALEGAVFVAHNENFDWRFLCAELARCRGAELRGERLCTLRLARRLHPELARRNLRVLSDYYSISFEYWHRAGPDARATAELFLRFLARLSEQGIGDWARLQAFLSGASGSNGGDPGADGDGRG